MMLKIKKTLIFMLVIAISANDLVFNSSQVYASSSSHESFEDLELGLSSVPVVPSTQPVIQGSLERDADGGSSDALITITPIVPDLQVGRIPLEREDPIRSSMLLVDRDEVERTFLEKFQKVDEELDEIRKHIPELDPRSCLEKTKASLCNRKNWCRCACRCVIVPVILVGFALVWYFFLSGLFGGSDDSDSSCSCPCNCTSNS